MLVHECHVLLNMADTVVGYVMIIFSSLKKIKNVVQASASTSILPLAIEEHCRHSRSKTIKCWKVSCIEILSPSRCIYSLPDRLAEEYKDTAMYSCSWSWAFVTDNFIYCNKMCANMLELVQASMYIWRNFCHEPMWKTGKHAAYYPGDFRQDTNSKIQSKDIDCDV